MSIKHLFLVVGLVMFACPVGSANGLPQGLFSTFDNQLEKYVDSAGTVNYRQWKTDRAGLDSFLKAAGKVTPQEYSDISKEDRLAFWINIYNAFTIKQILDHYPLGRTGLNLYPDNSIRQIDGVWDKFRIPAAGRNVSLSDIENKILRGELKEPLIHFAINCASRSCPKLLNHSYRGGHMIYKDLETAAFDFVNDKGRNKVDTKRNRIEISRIFEWFGDDFKERFSGKALQGRNAKESAVINFLQKYFRGDGRELLLSNNFSLGYLPYDWTLNEQ